MWHRVALVLVDEEEGQVWKADHRLDQVSEDYDYGIVAYDKEAGECVIAVAIGDEDGEKMKVWEQLGHVISKLSAVEVKGGSFLVEHPVDTEPL
ncbi:hypothetical protein ACFLXE_00065 [Chloroflexota bacterium]